MIYNRGVTKVYKSKRFSAFSMREEVKIGDFIWSGEHDSIEGREPQKFQIKINLAKNILFLNVIFGFRLAIKS